MLPNLNQTRTQGDDARAVGVRVLNVGRIIDTLTGTESGAESAIRG
jgi:hypothetical protein